MLKLRSAFLNGNGAKSFRSEILQINYTSNHENVRSKIRTLQIRKLHNNSSHNGRERLVDARQINYIIKLQIVDRCETGLSCRLQPSSNGYLKYNF